MSTQPRFLPLLSTLFVATLIASNIVAVKIGSFAGYFLPVAVIVFPVGYILSDIITEVYGFATMRRTIWLGFLSNLLVVGVITIASMIPPAPFYQNQEAFLQILGSTPRILGASFIAYLIGEFANATILSKLKIKTQGKWLPLRTIVSTIIGEGLDSSIFITLAFWGIFAPADIPMLILTQWIFKVAFEVLATPFTALIVRFLKRSEQLDHYDTGTSFNPFRF